MTWSRILLALLAMAAVPWQNSASAQMAKLPEAGIVQLTARMGQLCTNGQLRFLLGQEIAVSQQAQAWAQQRRLIVRYSDAQATVTIVPPASPSIKRQVPYLLSEITKLVINSSKCPKDAKTIPANIAVAGLDIVEEDGGPNFQLAP